MNKKKIALAILLLAGILVNVLIIKYGNQKVPEDVRLTFTADVEKQALQVYYGENKDWSEDHSKTNNCSEDGSQEVYFVIPSDSRYLRFDLGKNTGDAQFKNIRINCQGQSKEIDVSLFEAGRAEDVQSLDSLKVEQGAVKMTMKGEDPHVVINVDSLDMQGFARESAAARDRIYKPVMCAVIDLMLLVFCLFYERLFSLPKELYQNKRLILNLAKNDFKTRYAGSYLGIFWAFVQPVVTVMVYWFVFQVGFRSGTTQDCPFVLWLVTGIIPWFFFQEALIGGTNSMMEYSFLVKKVVFKISVLPIVKISASIFVHLFFIGFTIVLFICYGYIPQVHTIQLLYYLFCMFIFVLALSYATSAVVVFFKDLAQIINIFLQVGVWMTPIMWDYAMLTDPYPAAMLILKANPVFYIVQGYRNSLIQHVWFWEELGWTVYFWAVTGFLFVIGGLIFKRLKPHFSDVL